MKRCSTGVLAVLVLSAAGVSAAGGAANAQPLAKCRFWHDSNTQGIACGGRRHCSSRAYGYLSSRDCNGLPATRFADAVAEQPRCGAADASLLIAEDPRPRKR